MGTMTPSIRKPIFTVMLDGWMWIIRGPHFDGQVQQQPDKLIHAAGIFGVIGQEVGLVFNELFHPGFPKNNRIYGWR